MQRSEILHADRISTNAAYSAADPRRIANRWRLVNRLVQDRDGRPGATYPALKSGALRGEADSNIYSLIGAALTFDRRIEFVDDRVLDRFAA
jgi:hypothetical protein